MSDHYDGTIRWAYPQPVEPGSATIVIQEGANAKVTTELASSYSPLDVWIPSNTSPSFDYNGYTFRPTYQAIEDELNNNLNETYEIQPRSVDPRFNDTALQIKQTTSGDDLKLLFSDSNWTLDPRIFGFEESKNTDELQSGDTIAPPFSYLGAYHARATAPTLEDYRHDTDRRRFQSRLPPTYGYGNEWETAEQPGANRLHIAQKRRRLYLDHLESARVWTARTSIDSEGDRAELKEDAFGNYDPNAQLEHAWRAASRGPSFIFPQFDEMSSPLDIDWSGAPETKGVDMVQWAIEDQLRGGRAWLEDIDGSKGEDYRAPIELTVADVNSVMH